MAKAIKTKSGNYRVQLYLFTDNDGKKHYKSFTAPTKREALFKASVFDKTDNCSLKDKTSVYEAISTYIEAKNNVLSESTIRSYKLILKKHFEKSKIGKRNIYDLNNIIVQSWIKSLNETDLSPKTIKNIYGLFHSALQMHDKTIDFTVTLPKAKKKEVYIPTDKEVKMILANCDEQFKVAMYLAAYGGLRRGEICALTKKDFKDGGVYITKDMVLDENREWVIKDMPKTEAGIRYVPLADSIMEMVKECDSIADFYPGSLGKHLNMIQKKLGIERFSLHKLRHYCCSKLIEMNVSRQDIMYILGWTSPKMIDVIYGHSRIQNDRKRLKNISELMLK